MTSSMPWIKLYTEILDDHKFGTLPDGLKWRFVEICLLAGECDAEGYLANGDEPMDIDSMAWRLRRDPEQLAADLELFQQRGFLAYEEDIWLVVNFSKRQGRPQHEKRAAWRERKRRQRQREQDGDEEAEATPQAPPEPEGAGTDDNGHGGVTRDARNGPAPREEKSKRREEKRCPAVAGSSSSGGDTRGPPGLTEGLREMLRLFGAKRFATVAQKEALHDLERDHGTDAFLECAGWAAKQGMSMGKAVIAMETALPKWGKPKGQQADSVTVKGL